MSRGAMNKDVKYYCTRCQELEQELAELKELTTDLIAVMEVNQYEDVETILNWK